MTLGQFIGPTIGAMEDDTADHMADALTYLSRVAVEAGYHEVATDLTAVREKVKRLVLAERARSRRQVSS